MTLLSALAGDAEIEALLSDKAQISAMLAVEVALAEASADTGFIAPEAAAAITSAISAFTPDMEALATGFVQDGVVIPALIKQLRPLVAEPHGPALHKGATSQDVIDTALILQLAKVFDILEAQLSAILGQLDTLAQAESHRPLMAHTRMQAALLTTWGAKLATWSEPLNRHFRALAAMRRTLLVVQLAGPVGDRASFGTHGDAIAAGMAKRLDLGTASPWHTSRDPIVNFGNLLSLISGSLGKIGADLALLAQTEVAAVRLEGGGTSSAMAHKANPVNAELLVTLARFNAGLAGTLHQAMVHEYERSGAAWTLEWLTLPQMAVTTGASLRLAARALDQLRFN